VVATITEFGLQQPVLTDKDMAYWHAPGNRYWPTHYLGDMRGRLRHVVIDEIDEDINPGCAPSRRPSTRGVNRFASSADGGKRPPGAALHWQHPDVDSMLAMNFLRVPTIPYRGQL
jgi:hypothetical protein